LRWHGSNRDGWTGGPAYYTVRRRKRLSSLIGGLAGGGRGAGIGALAGAAAGTAVASSKKGEQLSMTSEPLLVFEEQQK